MHAVTAEPIRVSPPEAVVYQGLISAVARLIKTEHYLVTHNFLHPPAGFYRNGGNPFLQSGHKRFGGFVAQPFIQIGATGNIGKKYRALSY